MDVSFEQLVEVYRRIQWGDGNEGELVVENEHVLQLADAVLHVAHPDDTGVGVLEGDHEHLAVGDRLRVEVHQPKPRIGMFADTLADFVRYGQVKEPDHCYVREIDYASGEPNALPAMQGYRAVLAFLVLLRKSADYFDKSDRELVFAQGTRLTIPVRYTLEDIPADLAHQVSSLQAHFVDELHREQKFSILASAVRRVASAVTREKRFVTLLSCVEELAIGVSDGYRLFAASFSYERVKNEAKDAQIEFTAKIHRVFSDIQNQLLAIPVATIIVATQMRRVDGGIQFWINTGIMLGSVVFAVLFGMLAHNQRLTLDVLGEEIDRRRGVIASRYKTVDDLFKETFDELDSRLKSQHKVLDIISGLVCVGAFITVAAFFWLWLCHARA